MVFKIGLTVSRATDLTLVLITLSVCVGEKESHAWKPSGPGKAWSKSPRHGLLRYRDSVIYTSR